MSKMLVDLKKVDLNTSPAKNGDDFYSKAQSVFRLLAVTTAKKTETIV